MADEDDEEGFGDFKFAPTFLNYSTAVVDPNPKIEGRDSSFSDDDWGDFVTPKANQINAGFELSNGFSYSQAPLDLSKDQKPLDPFGNYVNNESLMSRVEEPDSDRADSDKAQWVKHQGALPLSLFGEVEEEEKPGADEPTVGDGAVVFFHKKDDSAKKVPNLNVGGGIDDLIANLYNQSPQIKSQNGSNQILNMNGGSSNSISNGSGMNFDGLVSNANGFDSCSPNMNTISNRFDSKINGVNSNSNRLYPNSTVLNSNFLESKIDGMNRYPCKLDSDFVKRREDLDDDGWEFKGAETEKQVSTLKKRRQCPGIIFFLF